MLQLVMPALAEAACSKAQRHDVVIATRAVGELRRVAAPGAADAGAVLDRARRRCAATGFARAVAAATLRFGLPSAGRRVHVAGYDLVGWQDAGAAVWRLDVPRLARRAAVGASTSRGPAHWRKLRSAGFGGATITWSVDATRPRWHAVVQSGVAAELARSSGARERAMAARTAAAFDRPARLAALRTADRPELLLVAARVAYAADRHEEFTARTAARRVAYLAYTRVRADTTATWSRTGGRWSTGAEHRALTRSTAALLVRVPHAPTAAAAVRLAAGLRTPPGVAFTSVPAGVFYPWPRDGAFDDQQLTVDVDKPGRARLTVFGSDGTVLREQEQAVEPGAVPLSWDGAAADGTIQPPGRYRYNVRIVDMAGNDTLAPGLRWFEVTRDRTPVAVRSASARYINGGSLPARLAARWDVEELHSPRVRTWIVLTGPAARRSVLLHSQDRTRGLRHPVTLPAGTWRATFVFIDGSGNRTAHRIDPLVVR